MGWKSFRVKFRESVWGFKKGTIREAYDVASFDNFFVVSTPEEDWYRTGGHVAQALGNSSFTKFLESNKLKGMWIKKSDLIVLSKEPEATKQIIFPLIATLEEEI